MKTVSKTTRVNRVDVYYVNGDNGISTAETTVYGKVTAMKVKDSYPGDNKIVHYNVTSSADETFTIPVSTFLKHSKVVDKRPNNKETVNRTMYNTLCTCFKIENNKPVQAEMEVSGKVTEKDIKKVQKNFPDIVYITNCRPVEVIRTMELEKFIVLSNELDAMIEHSGEIEETDPFEPDEMFDPQDEADEILASADEVIGSEE